VGQFQVQERTSCRVCKGEEPLLKDSKGLKVLRGCKAEPCWTQKAKPFVGVKGKALDRAQQEMT